MKEKELKQQFEAELIEKCTTARLQCGYDPTRLLQMISRLGGVETAKALIRRGNASDGFTALQAAGRLELSMEATVVESKYAALYTDEEADACLALLCECGYYRAN